MKTTNIDYTIRYLNELLEIDRKTISKLFTYRIECNQKLINHPTVQVGLHDKLYKVGLMGILNGLFGTDNNQLGYICMDLDDNNQILQFRKM